MTRTHDMRHRAVALSLAAPVALGVVATLVMMRAASPPTDKAPPRAKDDVPPAFRPYHSPIGQRFSTVIPTGWTHDATASGEGAAVMFTDTGSPARMRIFFFHDFVSEPGVRHYLSVMQRAEMGTLRPTQWSWSKFEFERAWMQDGTSYVGGGAIGHNGNRWFEVSWDVPPPLATTFGRDVETVVDRLRWDGDEVRTMVRGVVASTGASARTVQLVDTRESVAYGTDTRFVWDHGRPASASELRSGIEFEAVGTDSGGTLLAQRIVLYSGHPELGVG